MVPPDWRQLVTKFPLIAALLVATTVAAPALARDKTIFTADGVTYAYSQTKVGDSIVLQGRATPGDDFYYVVRDGKVIGNKDGMPVTFDVKDAAKIQDQAVVASTR